MDYYSRLPDAYTQSREIRNYADRLARRGQKIDGRMLYDIVSRIRERRPDVTGLERVRALQDLQFVTAPLAPRERYDLSSLFDRRDRSSRDAERILNRM
jgi:hypothetical protein